MRTQPAFSSEDDVAIGQLPLALQVTPSSICPRPLTSLLCGSPTSLIVAVTVRNSEPQRWPLEPLHLGSWKPEGTGLDFCEANQGLEPAWLHSVAHGEQALASPASVPLLGSIWKCRGSLRASVLAVPLWEASPEAESNAGWNTLTLAWKLLAFQQLLCFITWV